MDLLIVTTISLNIISLKYGSSMVIPPGIIRPWPWPRPIPIPTFRPINDPPIIGGSCGLFQIDKDQKLHPISLTSVSVRATVIHVAAQTEVIQLYVNAEQNPIETIYFFPLDPNGAVVHFHAELDGKIIKAIAKPAEEAKAQYDKAVEAKQTAFLGEENQTDIFKVRIGFLKPGSIAKIVLRLVSEVKNEKNSNGLRFYVPTTVAPRYIPKNAADAASKDLAKMTFTRDSSAPMSIKVSVSLQGTIKSVESPTHKIDTSNFQQVKGKPTWSTTDVELKAKVTEMDRDFVLLITPADTHKPRVYVEKLENSTVLMAHLIPSFKLKDQKSELIFVLDRSGSMMGQSIELARKALQLFLHSLPADCYFNVVGFGSSYTFLFNESVKYNDESLTKAKAHARSLGADMGGTEILEPLLEIYSRKLVPGYLRQIFVLTDGEVSNSDQVIGATRVKAHESRVFSIGIGDGASHHLVEGIAKAGGGTSAFVSNNEAVDEKVLQQLKDALQPSLTNVKVTWDGIRVDEPNPRNAESVNLPTTINPAISVNTEKTLLGFGKPLPAADSGVKNPKDSLATITAAQPSTDKIAKKGWKSYRQSPEKIPPIFDGSQLVIFGLLEGPNRNDVTGVTIQADSPDGPLKIQIPITGEDNNYADPEAPEILHLLAAIKLVRELELNANEVRQRKDFSSSSTANEDLQEEERLKREIVELATKFRLASRYTSFVAVDNSTDKNVPDSWVMETRYVPSKVVSGWHGGGGGFGGRFKLVGGMRPMMMSGSSGFYTNIADSTEESAEEEEADDDNSDSSNPTPVHHSHRKGFTLFKLVPKNSHHHHTAESADDAPSAGNVAKLDPVEKLVDLQSFDGSFSLDEKFAEAVQMKLDKLKAELRKNKLDPKSWATALAIAFLETKWTKQINSWGLVVEKGKKWIEKKHGGKLQEIVDKGQNFLTNYKEN